MNKLDRAPRVEKRSSRAVLEILRKWKPGAEASGERLELQTVWQWLEAKAVTEEKSLHEMPINPAGVRLTLVYGQWILDEKEEITAKELRHAAMASLDDYLKWDISEMAQFIRHQHDIRIRDNLRSHFSIVEKKLLEQIKAGSPSAMANWLRATGNYQGEKEDSSGYRLIKIPSSYVEVPLPEEGGEYKVMNNPVSTPST